MVKYGFKSFGVLSFFLEFNGVLGIYSFDLLFFGLLVVIFG